MNTTCPNCHTEFNIPDNVYMPGRKARCAICSTVFVLPEVPGFVPQGQAAAVSAQPTPAAQPQQPPVADTSSAPVSQAAAPAAAPQQPASVHVSVNMAPPQPQAAQPQQAFVQQPAQPVQAAPQAFAQPVQQTAQVPPQATPTAQPFEADQVPPQGVGQPWPQSASFDAAFAEAQVSPQAAPSGDPFAQAATDPAFAQPAFESVAQPEQQSFQAAPGASGVAQAFDPASAQAASQPAADPFAAFDEPQGQVLGAGDAHAAFAEAAARHAFGGAGVEAGGHFGGQAQPGASGLPGAQPGQAQSENAGDLDFASILGEAGASYDPFADDPASAAPEPEQSAAAIGVPTAASDDDDDLKARMAKFDADLDAVLNESPGKGEPAADAAASEAKKSGKGKKIIKLLLLLICLGGLGYGGYWAYSTWFSGDSAQEDGRNIISMEANELEKVRNLDVKSSGVKYEYIKNDKLGTILVLEGKVTNHFSTPKNRITVEARLFNAKGEVIKSQRQVCGVVLTPLQLSVLGNKELVKALNNRIEIMANNMGVQPGADVPFMVVFVYPPSHAVEFDVTVVDASDDSEPPAPAVE